MAKSWTEYCRAVSWCTGASAFSKTSYPSRQTIGKPQTAASNELVDKDLVTEQDHNGKVLVQVEPDQSQKRKDGAN